MLRKIIEIDEEKCTGCGLCIPGCAEGALAIVNGKAKIVKDMYCDGLGACLGHCPEGALNIIEREAEAFDEEAAMDHVRRTSSPLTTGPAHGCPSAQLHHLENAHSHGSALRQWPVQIRLIPPHAPFLRGADLLIAGDCCPVALPNLHQTLLQKKIIMLGCPKFDDSKDYEERFVQIFSQAGVQSVTVLEMEVPCCAGLSRIVHKAITRSGQNLTCKTLVVTRDGQVVEKKESPGELGRLDV